MEIVMLRKKLFEKEEKNELLQSQMKANDEFRESVVKKNKELKQMLSSALVLMKEHRNSKVSTPRNTEKLNKKRNRKLRSEKTWDGDFTKAARLDKFSDEKVTKKEVTFWKSNFEKMEKDLFLKIKEIKELKLKYENKSRQFKNYKKSRKEDLKLKKRRITSLFSQVNKLSTDCVKLRKSNEQLKIENRNFVQEQRLLKLRLDGYRKKLKEFDQLYNKTLGTNLIRNDSNLSLIDKIVTNSRRETPRYHRRKIEKEIFPVKGVDFPIKKDYDYKPEPSEEFQFVNLDESIKKIENLLVEPKWEEIGYKKFGSSRKPRKGK